MQEHEEASNTLVYYVKERDQINSRRRAGLIPWTEDQILSTYRFCNNRRDEDRGTKYLREVVHPLCTSYEDKVFNTVLYRFFNKVSTFEAFGGHLENAERLKEKLELIQKKTKQSVFSDAWQIVGTMNAIEGEGTLEKAENFAKLAESEIDYRKLPGVGSFIAYQIDLDLEIAKSVTLGPGSTAALKVLGMSFEEACKKFSDLGLDPFDLEHSLCEFHKYWRIKHFKMGTEEMRTVKKKRRSSELF